MNDSLRTEHAANEPHTLEELFLLHLRYRESRLLRSGGNRPILLDDETSSWIIYRGTADVFAVELFDGKPVGARTHLFRLHAGHGAFSSVHTDSNTIGLLLVGTTENTQLLQVDSLRLRALANDTEFAEPISRLLNHWVREMAGSLLHSLPPKNCKPIAEPSRLLVKRGQAISALRDVLWVKHTKGHSQFAADQQIPLLNGHLRWPISEHAWIRSVEHGELDIVNTLGLFAESSGWSDLRYFQHHILTAIERRLAQTAQNEQKRMHSKVSNDSIVVDDALRKIASPFSQTRINVGTEVHDSCLFAVMKRVAEAQNMTLTELPDDMPVTVANVARLSRFQERQVALKGDWWEEDNGPLLAFLEDGHHPVALLRQGDTYQAWRSTDAELELVDEAFAEQLESFAHMFYRPLPTSKISLLRLMAFGFQGNMRNAFVVLAMATLTGLIGLLVPLFTSQLFDRIIPQRDVNLLMQLAVVLALSVVAAAMFQTVQNLAMLRLQTKMGSELQAGVWDRVLNMPAVFFRDYSAGDLGNRVMGIAQIQGTLSGTILAAILSGVFSAFSFALLFYYSAPLGSLAALLGLVAAAVTLYVGYRRVAFERVQATLQGELTSIVLQAIQGIAKFRAAGAESKAFAAWGHEFGRFKTAAFESRTKSNQLQAFHAGYQVVISMALFAVASLSAGQNLTTGQFLAFNAAFLQFFFGIVGLSIACVSVLNIVPLYERAKPILDTPPETDQIKDAPGTLRGGLSARNVSFRYEEAGELVLRNVSFSVEPGEFIALVGASGSGKSTLFRLLLGFEQAEAGSIYYDNHLFSTVDAREVRRQIGVVLQNGQITSGTILSNIIGTSKLTIKDAWDAIKMAGLNRDIRNMPMGLNTALSQGGGALSGGQRQRLIIARAIVNRPRILFFDEATSALDSVTQQIVSESLESLQSTRVVIAHRLSTIINADRIYVMDDGAIVESGNYHELMQQDGLFAKLAKRQIAS